ncbi:MAG: hypothetical protein MI725_01780 [Pirellulales bacterium]|nr:hypothetical protein [Pirellulales bacterium]
MPDELRLPLLLAKHGLWPGFQRLLHQLRRCGCLLRLPKLRLSRSFLLLPGTLMLLPRGVVLLPGIILLLSRSFLLLPGWSVWVLHDRWLRFARDRPLPVIAAIAKRLLWLLGLWLRDLLRRLELRPALRRQPLRLLWQFLRRPIRYSTGATH